MDGLIFPAKFRGRKDDCGTFQEGHASSDWNDGVLTTIQFVLCVLIYLPCFVFRLLECAGHKLRDTNSMLQRLRGMRHTQANRGNHNQSIRRYLEDDRIPQDIGIRISPQMVFSRTSKIAPSPDGRRNRHCL
jgi:hypothetical protein